MKNIKEAREPVPQEQPKDPTQLKIDAIAEALKNNGVTSGAFIFEIEGVENTFFLSPPKTNVKDLIWYQSMISARVNQWFMGNTNNGSQAKTEK